MGVEKTDRPSVGLAPIAMESIAGLRECEEAEEGCALHWLSSCRGVLCALRCLLLPVLLASDDHAAVISGRLLPWCYSASERESIS